MVSLLNFKLPCGQKTFDIILASQKCVFDKRGLGYKCSKNENILKTILSKNPQVKVLQPFAIFYGRGGHISNICSLRNGSKKASTSK